MNLSEAAMIPLPSSMKEDGSSFALSPSSKIKLNDAALQNLADYLKGLLGSSTGYALETATGSDLDQGDIYLQLTEIEGNAEAYILEIKEDHLVIKGSEKGIFYGIQTLRQLLPPAIEYRKSQEGPWLVPTGMIEDAPVYAYRGAMLDVARHFFGVEDVKRYIDLISSFKINHLHLHLSDDQGWRIEIRSWPKLATHGGSTQVGGGKGGFYTQDQYTELVDYAAKRFITIVPEIDMPGHTNAILTSYPQLSCDGKDRELYTGIEVGFSTLCTKKESTYRFVDDVIRELSLITPGRYIHIGGDESLVTPLEDYIPFMERVQKIVTSYNKRVMGWDEIAHADLERRAVVQYWSEAENALKGVEKGAKVLMSPANRVYLDMQYDSTSPLGLHWAAYIDVDSAYLWNPSDLVQGIGQDDIIGVEAPLWSETLTKMDDIEYMAFPRLAAIAEVAWTPSAQRDWQQFRQRLAKFSARFDAMDVNYYPSPLIPWDGGIEKALN
ncbi:MAG: family 20 glycosylhydrolase [Saprospiraceae bacterium]|nr:family 20 glycosylhydrolase [Saprospiraceae bacterium]